VDRLRLGTRGSALARAQATAVAATLQQRVASLAVEIVVIGVSGDEDAGPHPAGGAPPAAVPAGTASPADKSRWVDRIEEALLAERIDLAVHSAKDVPRDLAPGLALLGAPPREDARDVLCGATDLQGLADGARVGTGSIRRAAQLRSEREDLEVVDLRGNVDTRLRRLAEGDYAAIVLALAGLRRLGRDADAGAHPLRGGGPLSVERFVPAPGQGVLALEGRDDDDTAASAARAVSDAAAIGALLAERALAHALDASCHTPLGAHARPTADGGLELLAFIGLPDGSAWLRDAGVGSHEAPEELGREVAGRMRAAGASELLARAEEMAVELA
jgi:hydroxymethylbilane synthase